MDLNEFITKLDKAGDLVRIRQPLSSRYDISAVLELADKTTGQAVVFERVRGYGTPIAGNLLSRRRRLALALGVKERDLLKEYSKRAQRRIKPRTVSEGPVTQRIVTRNLDILKVVPALTHRERDAGPYFTSAVTIAKDPESGATGMGIYRIQIRGRNKVSLNFQNPPLTHFLRNAETLRRELEVAVVVGIDPLSFIASVFPSPPGTDRFEIAGGLRGKPVELVGCKTIDVKVPAHAEFVLEGKVLPGVRVSEGPFGESWGTYRSGSNPIAKVIAIMSRERPIYHALLPFSGEETTLMGLSLEAALIGSLRAAHPGVISVASDRFNRSNLIVQMKKRSDDEPCEVLRRVLSAAHIVKTAVVVDDDIDPEDPYSVGFAISTRFQPNRGALVLDGLSATSLDPSATVGKTGTVTSKLGIDATRPLSAPKREFEMVRISEELKAKAKTFERYLKR
ncbi:MAG: hypothetical protein A3G25_06950 [Betaproteobacteria bacterium RIFCSPLOWO2_12_FULL_63_13]|nr:MAG: hypothetical protein A3G25_06950 [Betaproteobacteria bacterium RIFCSPLOWO2_12_FULL_63_13]